MSDDDKLTQEELGVLFPNGIPLHIFKIIFPERCEPLTNNEVRKILKDISELRNLQSGAHEEHLPSGRDIFEVANQLGGYVDPGTEKSLAKFLMKESEAANELAEEIVRLRIRLNNIKKFSTEIMDMPVTYSTLAFHGLSDWATYEAGIDKGLEAVSLAFREKFYGK